MSAEATDAVGPETADGMVRATAQTLDRGLQVLEVVARASDPLSASEIGSAVGLHRTVAHRLAGTLARRGYLHADGNGRYRPGTAILALASLVTDVRSVARPFLEELAERTQETVQLALPSGRNVVFIDGLESPQALRVTSRTGRTLPAHTTSVGKAWLATLDQKQLRELYPDEQLPQSTPDTISTRSKLEEVLAEVRRTGHAINEGENAAGVGSVGVVVRDAGGHARAAMSVAAPLHRLTAERRQFLAEALQETAERVGARLT